MSLKDSPEPQQSQFGIDTELSNWMKENPSAEERDFLDIHRIVLRNPDNIPENTRIPYFGKLYTLAAGKHEDADQDLLQQIASIGYLILSHSKETQPEEEHNFVKDRYMLMRSTAEVLIHTVIDGLAEINSGLDFISPVNQDPSNHWQRLYAMQYADLFAVKNHVHPSIFRLLQEDWDQLESRRENGFFGHNGSEKDVVEEGKGHHEKLLAYLREKVIERGEIRF